MAPTPRPDTVPLLIFLTPPGILCSSTPAPWLPVSPLAASFFVTIAFLLHTVARFRRRTRQQAAAARAAAAGRRPHACTRGRLQGYVPLEFDALELETAPDCLFEACIELLRLVAARFGSLLPGHPQFSLKFIKKKDSTSILRGRLERVTWATAATPGRRWW